MTEREQRPADLSPGITWRKSPYSADNHCVQIGELPGGGVAVRDSKDPHGPVLRFTAEEWAAFRLGITTGAI
jgi:hypothetical protein